MTALSENVATFFLDTNGVIRQHRLALRHRNSVRFALPAGFENPSTGEPSSEDDIFVFGAIVLTTLLVCSIIEVGFLYIYARTSLRHCCCSKSRIAQDIRERCAQCATL